MLIGATGSVQACSGGGATPQRNARSGRVTPSTNLGLLIRRFPGGVARGAVEDDCGVCQGFVIVRDLYASKNGLALVNSEHTQNLLSSQALSHVGKN
jgi:hypothetical protein